jgi:hypothetical protein
VTDEEMKNLEEWATRHSTFGHVQAMLTLKLIEENRRLKSGAFTRDEFMGLCHDKFPCSREDFEAGCKEYQDKIFGEGVSDG